MAGAIFSASSETEDQAIQLLKAFHDSVRDIMPAPWSERHARAILQASYTNPDILCVMTDGAILVAQANDHPFGYARVASELAWYSTGRRGLLLLKHYETWARERKCDIVQMVALDRNHQVGAIYERLGYVRAETSYSKRL